MSTHYEYIHRAGYGADDHMADEIIARAARQLGYNVGGRIAQAVGLASHPVTNGSCTVRLPSGPGVRKRMERALRDARSEVVRRDCAIAVVAVRERHDGCRVTREERRGRHWIAIATWKTEEPTTGEGVRW